MCRKIQYTDGNGKRKEGRPRISARCGKKGMKKHLSGIVLACILAASLLLTGCGGNAPASGSAEAAASSAADENVIKITKIEELPAAIAPDAVIELSAGKWSLADAFGEDYAGETAWEYARVEFSGEGYELIVRGVSNLTIRGAGADKTELVVEDPYADVIRFDRCSGIRLEKMTLGHDVEPGSCVGAVVELEDCSGCVLEELDLYGCGTYGVELYDCENITLRDSVVRECSYGILYCNDSTMKVENCTLKDCEGYTGIDAYESTMQFTNCTFGGNTPENGLLPTDGSSKISFDNCSFSSTESFDILLNQPDDKITFANNCKYAEIMKLPGELVVVSSMEEMFDAIAPNTTIVVTGKWHNMSDWMEATYAREGASWNRAHAYVDLDEVYDGVMATVKGVKNLAIVGQYSSRFAVNIMTDPRYADVLCFDDCENLLLANMSVGHTDTGDCTGSVVALYNCENVTIDNCDLYGCGVEGISAYGIRNLNVTDTHVRDCSFVALQINNGSGDVIFKDCAFYDNDCGLVSWLETPIVLDHCYLGWEESFDAMNSDMIRMIDCETAAEEGDRWYDYGEYDYYEGEEDWDEWYFPLEDLDAVRFDRQVLSGSVWNGFYRDGEGEGPGSWLDDGVQLIFDAEGTHCTLVGFWDGEPAEMELVYSEYGFDASAYEGESREMPDGFISLFADTDADESDLTLMLEYAESFIYFERG